MIYSSTFSLFFVKSVPVSFPLKIQFSKLPKIVEKRFSWWQEQIILPKNNFQALFEIVLYFNYFCKVRACRISVKNSILQKLPKIVEKHFSWWEEQIILPKNNFQALFEIVLNFHYFCKVCACRISVKNSIFQKLPKILEKHFSCLLEQIILQKKNSSTFWDSTKFSLFL